MTMHTMHVKKLKVNRMLAVQYDGSLNFLCAREDRSAEHYFEARTEGVYRAPVQKKGCVRLAADWFWKVALLPSSTQAH